VRAVLDPNVIISAALSSSGAPAEVLARCARGEFELVVSDALLHELARALSYSKLRQAIPSEDADALRRLIGALGVTAPDHSKPHAVRSVDPGDDYLIVLASAQRAALVSGDKHLLDLADEIPIFSPREFLALLGAQA
jgi:hypothetical protein